VALACARTVALVGVQGHVVEVQADIASGLPAFTLVGLPDTSLYEARDRVRAAVVNSGGSWPNRRITVNLSPASLRKSGSSFDLAIAVSVLAAVEVVPAAALPAMALLGELGLDGRLRAVSGVLPAAAAAARAGLAAVVVPAANAAEARLVPELRVHGVRTLRQVVALLRGELAEDLDEAERSAEPPVDAGVGVPEKDLVDVVGQHQARWALEVSAAGGHSLFLLGTPGAGKTMLAERLPGLLPDLERDAALEVTAIHSVAGTLAPGRPLVTRPPFQGPHHTATMAAVVGGGSGLPRPGAASLAHRGVLFLDEAPEFARGVLDALRQPLESGEIVLMRSAGAARYPARFRLVMAANPCPCGRAVGKGLDCICTPLAQRRYLQRLSGPLLDRIDLRVTVRELTRADLARREAPETSATVAARVAEAQARARRRLSDTPWQLNADVPGRELRRRWPLPAPVARPLEQRLAGGAVTMRGADRALRVAWTLADLAGRDVPSLADVQAAAALRIEGGVAA
jgi:magnesium chelatase family protein